MAHSPYKDIVVTDAEVTKHAAIELVSHFGDPTYGGSVKVQFIGNGKCRVEVYAYTGDSYETYAIDVGKVKL